MDAAESEGLSAVELKTKRTRGSEHSVLDGDMRPSLLCLQQQRHRSNGSQATTPGPARSQPEHTQPRAAGFSRYMMSPEVWSHLRL